MTCLSRRIRFEKSEKLNKTNTKVQWTDPALASDHHSWCVLKWT